MLKRTIQCLALGGSAFALGVVACGSPAVANPTPTTNATVTLAMFGSSGTQIGSCGGTLIAADTVLTAAHCAAGASSWKVGIPATGQTAKGSIAYTFDWNDLSTSVSHPLHHDVAVIKLDTPIALAGYPSLASSGLPEGAAAMRVRQAADGVSYEAVATRAYDGASAGFADYYYSSVGTGESLVTGTALIDAVTNTIYGVVSGVGYSTGNLYSSRVESVSSWLAGMEDCSASATIASVSTDLRVLDPDCHPTPPPPCDDDGGSSDDGGGSSGTSSGASSGASSSSSGSSSGSSNGTTGGSTGASSSGNSSGGNGTNGGGGDGGTCGGGGGYCQGNGCPGGGGNGTTGGSSSGASSGTSSGTSSGASSGTSSGGNGTTGSSGGGSNGTSSGYNGASSSGTTSGGNGTTGSGGGGDNGCTDPSCGGCADDPSCSDNTIDYGGSTTPPPSGSNPP